MIFAIQIDSKLKTSCVAYENVIITTYSSAEAFPSALRQKRKTQTKHHEKGDQGTLVSDSCWTP